MTASSPTDQPGRVTRAAAGVHRGDNIHLALISGTGSGAGSGGGGDASVRAVLRWIEKHGTVGSAKANGDCSGGGVLSFLSVASVTS